MESIARMQLVVAVMALSLTVLLVSIPNFVRFLVELRRDLRKERREKLQNRIRSFVRHKGTVSFGDLVQVVDPREKRLRDALESMLNSGELVQWQDHLGIEMYRFSTHPSNVLR